MKDLFNKLLEVKKISYQLYLKAKKVQYFKSRGLFTMIMFMCAINNYAQYYYMGAHGGVYTYTTMFQNSMGQRLLDYDFAFGAGSNLLFGYNLGRPGEIRFELGYTPAGAKMIGGSLRVQNEMMYYSFSANYIYTPDVFNNSTKIYFGGGLGYNSLNNVNKEYRVNGKETSFINFIQHNNNNNINNNYIVNQVEKNGDNLNNEVFFTPIDIRINALLGIKSLIGDNIYLHAEVVTMLSIFDINHPDWRLPRKDGKYKASRHLIGGVLVGLTYEL